MANERMRKEWMAKERAKSKAKGKGKAREEKRANAARRGLKVDVKFL